MAKTFRPRPAKGKVNAYTDFENWAADVQSNINLVESEASAAQSTANSGVSKADVAQSTANAAQSAANAAQTTANTGVTNAYNAQTTADMAYDTAVSAEQTANSAESTANKAFLRNGDLGTQSLNLVDVEGTYFQHQAANATFGRAYPVVGGTCVLVVMRRADNNNVVQELTIIGALSSSGTTYKRMKVSGTWGAWEKVATYSDISTLENKTFPIIGQIGNVHLNTLTSPGIYRQTNSAYATPENGFPAGGHRWIIEVILWDNGAPMQRLTPTTGTSEMRGNYHRRIVSTANGTWSPWYFIPSQRVDESAGRAVYTWDDLNNREQLIYGDTGTRDIAALLKNGWTATAIQLTRFSGYVVELKIVGLGGSPTAGTIMTLPPGFQLGTTGAGPRAPVVNSSGVLTGRLQVGSDINANSFTVNGDVTMMWRTNQAWPSVLPGTLVGSIPNL